MLTNVYNADTAKAIKEKAASYQLSPEKADALLYMSGGVVESYMTYAIDLLSERYGSVEGYLRDELDVGTEELSLLRERFLA